MAFPIHEYKEQLVNLCHRYQVKTLELFGSAVTDAFDPKTSDLDFLVDFLPLEPRQHGKAYFDLWFALQELFGRQVDLVETPAIRNPYFIAAIKRQRQVIYDAA